MDATTFLDNFATIAEAPGGVQRLRGLVLRLAVRGQLVEQDPSEDAAAVLLAGLPARRDSLVASGVIGKPRHPEGSPVDDPPHEIPTTWAWARLGDVGAVVGGGTPKSGEAIYWADGPDIPWLTPADMRSQTSRLVSRGARDITERGLAESSAQLLPAGAVLFSSRAPIGHVGIAAQPLATNQGFKSCVPYVGAMTEYLYLFLRYVGPIVDAAATGTTFKEVSSKDVALIPVPVPPLAEQERIVAKVDELMGLCDELEARQERRHRATARFRGSALHALTDAETPDDLHHAWERVSTSWPDLTASAGAVAEFRKAVVHLAVAGHLTARLPGDGTADDLLRSTRDSALDDPHLVDSEGAVVPDPYRLPSTWRWVALGSVAVDILAGWSAPSTQQRRSGEEWAVLKVSACTWGSFRPDENKALRPGTPPREELEVRPGDLLITRANTADLVARSVVVDSTPPRLMLSDKTLRIPPVRGCNPRYLNLANLAPPARAHYRSEATGTSDSMKNVSQRAIRRAPIPLPPTAEQDRIVGAVDRLNRLCDNLAAALDLQAGAIERLARAVSA